MTTLETEVLVEKAIAIFRNEYRGRDIGEILVRTHRSRFIVTAPVDGKLERLQLAKSVVIIYSSDNSDESVSVSTERTNCTGDTTDSFANHLLDNDFHAYIVSGEGVNDESSHSTFE